MNQNQDSMSGIFNPKENHQSGIIDLCILCEEPLNEDEMYREDVMHSYTSEPCTQCQSELDKGNYIFVLVSDQSTEEKIHRLHRTWIVEPEEVEKVIPNPEEEFGGEQIAFIRESKAMKIGLLDEKVDMRGMQEEDETGVFSEEDDIE